MHVPLPSWLTAVLLAGLSAALVRLMVVWGALDHPGHRSSHSVPTPKGGGIGIVAAVALGLVLLPPGVGELAPVDTAIAAGAALLAAAGYADDVFAWRFLPKLAAQVAAACLVLAAGLSPRQVLGVDLPLAMPLAFCWLMFVTNAINFLDGLNGLVAGSGAVFALALAAEGSGFLRAACLGLLAGIAGFLPFNYPRARVFMGDAGSQFMGFLLAALSLRAMAPASGVPPLLAPMLLAPLLLDAAFTLARRLLAGDRVTEAHRGHLYQLAHRSGVPAAAIAAVVWGLVAWAGGAALLAPRAGASAPWAVALGLVPAVAVGVVVLVRARMRVVGRW